MRFFLKRILFLCFLLLFFYSAYPQSNYWQQHVDYKINVTLNDVLNELNGDIQIVYTNNSPDTLNEIYFHLWPNAYKNRKTALTKQLVENKIINLYFATDKERGFISDLEFRVNNELIAWQLNDKNIDIALLQLSNPLLPGSSITITTPFKVKIPTSRFSRLGHKNQNYQITQWYPKPAVYDKNGWHPMPYLSLGEFYSEFGSFEVNITLPENYIVAATGNLLNDSEKKWLSQLAAKPIDYALPISNEIESSSTFKTITYIQDSVHDFAWFASKALNVQKIEFKLPASGKNITAWTYFPSNEAKLWELSTEYVKNSVLHYSKYVGEYPYKVVSAIHAPISAGSGMEYPTITVIGNSGNAGLLETVLVHEVGHNWFYGILGSNERLYPWMDEGMNTYFESHYFLDKDDNPYDEKNQNLMSFNPFINSLFEVDRLNYIDFYENIYTAFAAAGKTQPVNTSAPDFEALNYSLVAYMKVGVLFNELKNYLGEKVFQKCVQNYYQQYQFKHPYPEDVKRIFEEESGKNLSWFFIDSFNTSEDSDYKIKSLKKTDNGAILTVKNKSNLTGPLSIGQYKQNKLIQEGFEKGFNNKQKFEIDLIDGVDKITVGQKGILDINEKNNSVRTKGLFKTWNKVRFKFIGAGERDDRSTIYYAPAVDFNYYDKFMLGGSFYNSFIKPKKFEYFISPMYAFGSSELTGRARTAFNFVINKNKIHSIKLEANTDYFNFSLREVKLENENPTNKYQKYLRINPSVNIYFKKKNYRNSVFQSVVIESKSIYRNKFNYDRVYEFDKEVKIWKHFYNISYDFNNSRAIDPFKISLTSEFSEEHGKLSAAFTQKVTYYARRGEASIRFYAGAFLFDDSNAQNDYRFRLSGWRGIDDYTFDNQYIGKTESDGIWSQQMVLNDAAFKVPTFIGQTREWIAAINISASLPGINFIGAFADLGTFDKAGKTVATKQILQYDAGLWFNLANIVKVYFPFIKSNDIKNSLDTNDIKFGEQIRFTFDIEDIRLYNLRKTVLGI